jgi:Flp pilus assembly protein TadB
MALPEKRDELNRTDEQTMLTRMDDQNVSRIKEKKIAEHHRLEDREYRDQHRREEEHRVHGHDFEMDLHPERYPRESLSRLEEGILEDEELRHADDHLGFSVPDLEVRIDNTRRLSRLLVMLGAFLLLFACVLLLWVGWDVRSGSIFFTTMDAIAVVVGLALIGWGYIERREVVRLLTHLPRTIDIKDRERIERNRTERELRESDSAA